MSIHTAHIAWSVSGPDFRRGQYSREHSWHFDGGITVPASPSPTVVPAPWSNAAHVDPEEAYVAAVASCHMLWWLSIAAKHGFDVLRYEDHAFGSMTRNGAGKLWVSEIELRPRITYGARAPSSEEEGRLHALAHEECFIAQSIRTEVRVVTQRHAGPP